ncbi:MAG: hypothetical protein K1X75_00255 [Leptospirales bacterium]|nr:hypothetical protein [Leptospirales bacterium]
MRSLLLCGAFGGEIDRLQAWNGRSVLVGGEATAIHVAECGIGNIDAALAWQRWQCERGLSSECETLFLGSAGACDQQFPAPWLGGAVIPTHIHKREAGLLLGHSKLPPRLFAAIPENPGNFARRLRSLKFESFILHEGTVNCPDAVSLDHAELYLQEGLQFENLECYGLARAAELHGAAFSALLAITNHVGPKGSEQWRRNYAACSAALQNIVLQTLQQLAT